MIWDQSAQKLAYLAEKKMAKVKPFFSSNVKVVNDDQDKKPDDKKTELKVKQNIPSPSNKNRNIAPF